MKERPILFSGPMVRAILDGRKTQTRRVMKPQPHRGVPFGPAAMAALPGDWTWPNRGGCSCTISNKPGGPDGWAEKNSPVGVPGDRLWVRETLRWSYNEGQCTHGIQHPPEPSDLLYDATNEYVEVGTEGEWAALSTRSERIPAIHMPRWASRVTLEVVSVRVERLADISDADAKAEGYASADEFLGAPWAVSVGPNPWVWVVEFRRITP